MDEAYPDDLTIAGIKWKSTYSQARVIFEKNQSDEQFTNIDFRIRTSIEIASIGFVSKFSQCNASAIIPTLSFSNPVIFTIDANGRKIAVPLDGNHPSMPTIYRVFCDRIIARDKLEVVVAAVPKLGTPANSGKPTWMAINGTFDGLGRSRALSEGACLIDKCQGIELP